MPKGLYSIVIVVVVVVAAAAVAAIALLLLHTVRIQGSDALLMLS